MELLRSGIYLSRKGNMSIRTVSLVVLGVLTVALLFMAANTWLQDVGGNFIDNVKYPAP